VIEMKIVVLSLASSFRLINEKALHIRRRDFLHQKFYARMQYRFKFIILFITQLNRKNDTFCMLKSGLSAENFLG